MARPRLSDTRRFRRALTGSLAAHALLLAYLALSIPFSKPPEPPEPPTVEMDFDQSSGPPSHPPKGDHLAPRPAPSPAPVQKEAPPAPTPPKAAPIEEPPPPPPPPPPVPPPPESKPQELPPTDLPPKVTQPEPSPVPASPPRAAPPSPSTMVTPPNPQTEKVDKLPDMPKFSHLTQPNQTKNSTPDSHSLLATLESFRADQKQTHPPRNHANPDQGGAPNGGGVPNGDITGSLSATDQKAIGGSVRRCYTEDTEAKNYASFVAHLVVTVDATGEARIVTFAPETAARMAADPSYRALAERARDAVLSPACAHLPVPAAMLGKTHQLRFVFRP